MHRMRSAALWAALLVSTALSAPAFADAFFFTTGGPNGLIATASRPGPATGVNQETESADDFLLPQEGIITGARFTGIILPPPGVPLSSISQVVVEIYRVFPNDSDVARTSGPPTFSTPQVPTRVNSPSDVEFDDRNSASSNLIFTTTLLNATFSAANSVDTVIGVHAGGDGPVTGQEVQFDVTFTTPFDLPPGHYFFVPQVLLSDPSQHFLWLSGDRPLTAPTDTPFMPDLQSWMRNDALQPDWLRIGTDIIGGTTTFNGSFALAGEVPEPATLGVLAAGLGLLGLLRRRRRTDRPFDRA
jgi:hypothetical protein